MNAIQGLLGKIGWKKEEVDLFEINEAFAACYNGSYERNWFTA
nr:hypothetical protein [Coxiella-like endosymbiont of Rhipicephalus sanguineus]